MTPPVGYHITAYGAMVGDQVRTGAYSTALERAVRPGCVVLDIGAGTGIISLLACRLGAGMVYAVEPDNAITVAREIAAANGYADRIEFLQELSTAITLPEPADVVVSDLRGVLPLFQHHVAAIVDARRRHLRPGGALVPVRDTMHVAIVEAPELHRDLVGPSGNAAFDFDMGPAQRVAANNWCKVHAKPEQLLTAVGRWAVLDYTTITETDVAAEVVLAVERPGVGHGLLAWFDGELVEGVGFSNAPGQPELIYGQAFFAWPQPVELAAGDTVRVFLAADLVGDDYVWRWNSRVMAPDGAEKAGFAQSTFHGVPITRAQLRKRVATYRPTLDDDGRRRSLALARMDGQQTLAEIASDLAAHYPELFASEAVALALLRELSARYSR